MFDLIIKISLKEIVIKILFFCLKKDKFMKKSIFLILGFFLLYWSNSWLHPANSQVKGAQLTDQEKSILQQERTTNLVILNDIDEINPQGLSKAMRQILKSALMGSQVVLCTKALLLAAQKEYGSFIPENYICKEVSDDYLLFIPEEMQHSDQPLQMQDALLGLSYSKLSEYDYKSFNQKEFDKVQTRCETLTDNMIGKMLLTTLQALEIKNIDHALLPFSNIYLSGHGNKGVIAEISTKSSDKNEPSDFLKIMNFFDKSLRTKSVALVSCFIGGKQTIDTYGMYDKNDKPVFDKFSNKILEDLSYTIINWGSLNKPVYVSDYFDFSQYFNLLNEPIPNYEQVLKAVRTFDIDNYLSIKLPHTSWFSPVQLKQETQTLSQVAMSTQERAITIKNIAKVIILEANYTPQPVKINSYNTDSIPAFMPVNYHNQAYYFTSLQFNNFSQYHDFFEVLNYLIFKNILVDEEINFAFEKIQISSVVYKNVHCFVSKATPPQDLRTGFVYEDSQGRVFKYSWAGGSKGKAPFNLNDISVKSEQINKETWDQEFKIIGQSIQELVPESMRPKFIQGLSKKIDTGKKVKLAVGKNLNKINLQLNENLIKPQDLDVILPLLEKGINDPSPSVQDQAKRIFDKLLSKDIITPDNFKKLIPLLNKGFNNPNALVRTQIDQMMDQLINQHVITTENWVQLQPILKTGIKNSNSAVKDNVGRLLGELISIGVIKSIKNIEPLLEQSVKDNNYRFYSAISLLAYSGFITKSEIEHLINLTSDNIMKENLEKLKEIAPVSLSKPLDEGDKFVLFLGQKLKDFNGPFSDFLEYKEYVTLKNLIKDGSLTLDKILPLIKENMNDSDALVRVNTMSLIDFLIRAALITKDNIVQFWPLIEKGISDPQEDVRTNTMNMISSLIKEELITKDQLLPLVEKALTIKDQLVPLVENGLITKNVLSPLIAKGLITKNQLLSPIEKGMTNSDNIIRENVIDLCNSLIEKGLLTQDQLFQLIEKGLNSTDLFIRINVISSFAMVIGKGLIIKDSFAQYLPIIEKLMNYPEMRMRSEALYLINKLIYKDLISKDNIAQWLPLVEKGMSDPQEFPRSVTTMVITSLVEKGLLTQQDIEKFESLAQGSEIQEKLKELKAKIVEKNVPSISENIEVKKDQEIVPEQEEDRLKEERQYALQEQKEKHVQLNEEEHRAILEK